MGPIASLAALAALTAPMSSGCDLPQLVSTVEARPYSQSLRALGCYRHLPGANAYLATVLKDARLARSWPVAVAVLGVIGDQDAYNSLVGFLGRQQTHDTDGAMLPDEFSAKVDAIAMIDYLRRYGPDQAVKQRAARLLRSLTAPAGWQRYPWTSPDHLSREQSNAYLAGKTRFFLNRRGAAE